LKNLNFIQSISERDVDLLLLEEFQISEKFCDWFTSRVFEYPVFSKRVGAWHSVIDSQHGESDLVLIFEVLDGSHHAILIENKIDAPAQREQGLRYRVRGEKGIEDDYWVEFKTCLIAPQKYLLSNSEIYDRQISYEEIMSYFIGCTDGQDRAIYRSKFILESIQKNRRGYQPVLSPEMTQFASDYIDYVNLHFPELNPEKSKPRAPGNTWVRFYPFLNNKEVQIIHQIYGNFVKLVLFSKAESFDLAKEKYAKYIDDELAINKAGKSITLSYSVPDINPLEVTFDSVVDKIKQSLQKALALKDILDREGSV
jgi:hypothetical protein